MVLEKIITGGRLSILLNVMPVDFCVVIFCVDLIFASTSQSDLLPVDL